MTIAEYEQLRAERPELRLDAVGLLVGGERDVIERVTPDELAAFCTGQLLVRDSGEFTSGFMWLLKHPLETSTRFSIE